jgi:RND family efflux transporter MFP subunit
MPVLAAGLLSLAIAGCAEEQAAVEAPVVRPVKIIELTVSDGASIRQYPGQVRAAQRADLSFEVSGKLQELPIREGQVLNKGDLVAALDDRDLTSALKSARAEFNNAVANFRRGSTLVKDGNISKVQFDKLKAQRDVTAANLAKAEKAVADTRLTAPFGGRVATRFVENFQDVQAKQPIISLQDVEGLEILVDVPESRFIRATRPGQPPPTLTARFDAFPDRRFDLAIKEFATEADPTTQSFRVVLSMPQPEDLQILPGMTAMVIAELAATGDAESAGFRLPAIAIFADEAGRSQVWVVDPQDNTVHRRAVETGKLVGADSIRVESGLEPGELVAVSAVSRLREGMEVRPIEEVTF